MSALRAGACLVVQFRPVSRLRLLPGGIAARIRGFSAPRVRLSTTINSSVVVLGDPDSSQSVHGPQPACVQCTGQVVTESRTAVSQLFQFAAISDARPVVREPLTQVFGEVARHCATKLPTTVATL
jgi:hypothetical protein